MPKIYPATEDILVRAVDALRSGRLVAFPTETVYGLGASAVDATAVSAIYRLKGRPSGHPLIVHLADAGALPGWVSGVPAAAEALIEAFWPGPLTLVFGAGPRAHSGLTGGQPTVAVRVPSHPVAHALLSGFGAAIAAPSANRFGRISPTRAQHVADEFPDAPLMVLDGGASRVGLESTIVDMSGRSPTLLRPGSISPAAIAEVLGTEPAAAGREAPRAPGRLPSHYAPATPTALLPVAAVAAALVRPLGRIGVISFGGGAYRDAAVWRSLGPDPVEAARGLYATLRELDAAGLDRILVESPPATPAWIAVRDRLDRAAGRDALPLARSGGLDQEE